MQHKYTFIHIRICLYKIGFHILSASRIHSLGIGRSGARVEGICLRYGAGKLNSIPRGGNVNFFSAHPTRSRHHRNETNGREWFLLVHTYSAFIVIWLRICFR